MKRMLLVLTAVLLACSVAFAQTEPTKAADNVSAAVMTSGVQIGPNSVTVVAKHADGTVFYRYTSHNLKTTGGVDWLAKVMSATSAAPGQAYYLAVSTDSGSPAAGDCAAGSTACTLTGEVSTSGLGRAAGTFAHTDGQSTYTLVKQWTASGTVSSVQKAAVFNASSSGTMVFENTFSAVTLNNGDTLQVTWTITIS